MVPSWTPNPPREDAPESGPSEEGATNLSLRPRRRKCHHLRRHQCRWPQQPASVARVGLSASTHGQETAMR